LLTPISEPEEEKKEGKGGEKKQGKEEGEAKRKKSGPVYLR